MGVSESLTIYFSVGNIVTDTSANCKGCNTFSYSILNGGGEFSPSHGWHRVLGTEIPDSPAGVHVPLNTKNLRSWQAAGPGFAVTIEDVVQGRFFF